MTAECARRSVREHPGNRVRVQCVWLDRQYHWVAHTWVLVMYARPYGAWGLRMTLVSFFSCTNSWDSHCESLSQYIIFYLNTIYSRSKRSTESITYCAYCVFIVASRYTISMEITTPASFGSVETTYSEITQISQMIYWESRPTAFYTCIDGIY